MYSRPGGVRPCTGSLFGFCPAKSVIDCNLFPDAFFDGRWAEGRCGVELLYNPVEMDLRAAPRVAVRHSFKLVVGSRGEFVSAPRHLWQVYEAVAIVGQFELFVERAGAEQAFDLIRRYCL